MVYRVWRLYGVLGRMGKENGNYYLGFRVVDFGLYELLSKLLKGDYLGEV